MTHVSWTIIYCCKCESCLALINFQKGKDQLIFLQHQNFKELNPILIHEQSKHWDISIKKLTNKKINVLVTFYWKFEIFTLELLNLVFSKQLIFQQTFANYQ